MKNADQADYADRSNNYYNFDDKNSSNKTSYYLNNKNYNKIYQNT